MRWLPIAVAGVLVFPPTLTWAQKADKDKKQDTQITHVGGKTLEEWIKLIPSKDRSIGENAIRTVLLFGPERAQEALPKLVAELKKHWSTPIDVSIRVNVIMAIGIILEGVNEPQNKLVQEAVYHVKRFMGDTQAIVRYRAAEALGKIGPEARIAIPELIGAVSDPSTWEIRQAACKALAYVSYDEKAGPPTNVIQALYNKGLNDIASEVRLAAIQSLTFMGPPSNLATRQALYAALTPVATRGPELRVQIWANMALMSLTGELDAARISPIIAMLGNKDIAIRVQAMQAIGVIAAMTDGNKKNPTPIGLTKVKGAVPKLTALLADPEPIIVFQAAMVLGRMDAWAAEAIPMLEKIVQDKKSPDPLKKVAQDAIDGIKGKKAK